MTVEQIYSESKFLIRPPRDPKPSKEVALARKVVSLVMKTIHTLPHDTSKQAEAQADSGKLNQLVQSALDSFKIQQKAFKPAADEELIFDNQLQVDLRQESTHLKEKFLNCFLQNWRSNDSESIRNILTQFYQLTFALDQEQPFQVSLSKGLLRHLVFNSIGALLFLSNDKMYETLFRDFHTYLIQLNQRLSCRLSPDFECNTHMVQKIGGLPPISTSNSPLVGYRVLHLDDCPIQRKMVKRYLENNGAELCQVSSSFDAIKVLQEEPPFDILLFDIMLGEQDHTGLSLARWLRSTNQENVLTLINVPIIAVTGNADASDIVKYKEYMDGVFKKGQNLQKLLKVMLEQLAS